MWLLVRWQRIDTHFWETLDHDFWHGSGSVPLTDWLHCLSVIFKMLKNIYFSTFSYYTFWSYIYTPFFKDKSHKKSQNSWNKAFSQFSLFLLDDLGGSGSGSRSTLRSVQIMTDPGGPKTYGTYRSGSATLVLFLYYLIQMRILGSKIRHIQYIDPDPAFFFLWSKRC